MSVCLVVYWCVAAVVVRHDCSTFLCAFALMFTGANNSPKPSKYLSSFDTLDYVVNTLLNNTLYPDLKLITLAGFSAGAQLLNRYSWASDVGKNGNYRDYSTSKTVLKSDIVTSTTQPAVRFIISDASSYLYFDSLRPDESCRPLTSASTASTENCSSFHALSESEVSACGTFDEWKYGLTVLPNYWICLLGEIS